MLEDAKQSLIGVRLGCNGAVSVETTHRDGSTEQHILETTDRHGSVPIPQDWRPRGGALEENERNGLTRSERVDQSVRVEAAMLKVTSSCRGSGDLKKAAVAALFEVMTAMGGEWAETAKRELL